MWHFSKKSPKNHIKGQIKATITINSEFAGNINQKIFFRFLDAFLDANTYGESEHFARRLINLVHRQHDKGFFGPTLESLNNFEFYENYEYKKQRLHFIHQVNVFLLGLFLYHNVPFIREKIGNEMNETRSDRSHDLEDKGFIYNTYNEFLYRWRLASLSHDIGYGISLSGNDEQQIKDLLEDVLSIKIQNLDDLWKFNNKNLLSQLDSSISEISIKQYMQNQCDNPFKSTVYYDHGIISSLIFLRLLNQEYANHRNNKITYVGSSKIVWDEYFLKGSILQAAVAIALHNLDQNSVLFQEIANNQQIFNLEERPLSWLLKVSDILQEWDKPKADERIMCKKIKPINMQIFFKNNKIVVKNFPKKKLDDVKKVIMNYSTPSDLINFV